MTQKVLELTEILKRLEKEYPLEKVSKCLGKYEDIRKILLKLFSRNGVKRDENSMLAVIKKKKRLPPAVKNNLKKKLNVVEKYQKTENIIKFLTDYIDLLDDRNIKILQKFLFSPELFPHIINRKSHLEKIEKTLQDVSE